MYSFRRGMCGSFRPRSPDDRFLPFGGGLQWTFRLRLNSEGCGHFKRSSRETTALSDSDSDLEALALDRLDSLEMLLMLELHGVAVEAKTAELLSSVS